MSPKQKSIKRIAWVTSTLHTAGGGSRLLLEGVQHYRNLGIEVLVITWDFHSEALFDGRYSGEGIVEIEDSHIGEISLVRRAVRRLKTIRRLRKEIRQFKPDLILNQSEYDATLIQLALTGARYPMASFVFGQMFQFHQDIAKYSWPFNRHLDEIRLSTPGYRELVPAKRPKSTLAEVLLAQIIAIPRYFALRSSIAIFVFSKQVQWEVSKIYGAPSHVLKGAYPRSCISSPLPAYPTQLRRTPDTKILLSLSRLILKKRVALKIEALSVLITERGWTNLHLVIGGKGEEWERLQALVDKLQIRPYVTFLGYVPEEQVFPLTAASDVYLSLDVADFDISPYEALAMRRRIVWSSEMDLDEYLESCGAIFPTEPTPHDLADAIEETLKREESAIDWSGLDRYSWETYFDNILNVSEQRL